MTQKKIKNAEKSADNAAMELIALAHQTFQVSQETNGEKTCYKTQWFIMYES